MKNCDRALDATREDPLLSRSIKRRIHWVRRGPTRLHFKISAAATRKRRISRKRFALNVVVVNKGIMALAPKHKHTRENGSCLIAGGGQRANHIRQLQGIKGKVWWHLRHHSHRIPRPNNTLLYEPYKKECLRVCVSIYVPQVPSPCLLNAFFAKESSASLELRR
jgi:hypothetical protein